MSESIDFELKEVLVNTSSADLMVMDSSVRTVTIASRVQAEVEAECFTDKKNFSDLIKQVWSPLRLVLLVAIWWISAIFVVMVIKVLVAGGESRSEALFPYPFAVTAFTNTTCGIFSFFFSHVARRVAPEASMPKLTRRDMLKLSLVGLMQGVEIACNNKALEYLSLSGRTMLNSINILFMMGTALCWKLENLGVLRIIAVACLTGGGLLQGVGLEEAQEEDSKGLHEVVDATLIKGVLVALGSMVIGSQRWAAMQFLMQRSGPDSALGQMSKLQIMVFIMPVTGLVCFILAAITEIEAFSNEYLGPALAVSILKIATGVLALSVAELKLVHLTSAVAVQVLATIHQIPIVLAGVIFFDEHLSLLGMCGFGLCLSGALFYVAARRNDVHADAAAHEDASEAPAMDSECNHEEDESRPIMPEVYGTADGAASPTTTAEVTPCSSVDRRTGDAVKQQSSQADLL